MRGIYKLYFPQDPLKVYVGQSVDIDRRYKQHLANLKKGVHHNWLMQAEYNRSRMIPLEEVLEECSIINLDTLEISWVERLGAYTNGYNLTKGAEGSTLVPGEHFNAAHEPKVYLAILNELAATQDTHRVIATRLKVHKRVVDSIKELSNHKYLKDEYPELYAKMVRNRSIASKYIRSPEGVIYTIKRGQGNAFAKAHGLDGNSLNSVLRGGLQSTQKWTKAEKPDEPK
jgi:hypothetical protein